LATLKGLLYPAHVAGAVRKRELGRGERVLPGVFRLRLPLSWPGVPHCNAWAVARDGGFVLFDTGMHQPGSLADLQRALEMCGLRLEDVRLVACTHAHSDHCGQAGEIVRLTGCQLWMHPRHELMRRMTEDPDAVLAQRVEIARQSGVPEEPLRRATEERRERGSGWAGPIEPDRDLLAGMTIDSDLGPWTVYETPGHSPSHVCMFQRQRRLLISGDHLLGRISLFFEYGSSPDPVGEFLSSLDVVDELGARLCLPGHGRTFTDVRAHIDGNRELVAKRLAKIAGALGEGRPLTGFELVPRVHEGVSFASGAPWLLHETLALLTHLERSGRARRIPGEPERWTA
jgi:glyoxylase-like metal-dependent hydrolase (beta-lactamase superfamily II)